MKRMKIRINIHLEEGIIRHARQFAAEEGRPFSDLIQDAVISYLGKKTPDLKKREGAFQIFCGQPMRLSKNQLKEVLEDGSG